MPGLVSDAIVRVLPDRRGKISKMGDNPISHDTFFISANGFAATTATDITVVRLNIVPPEVLSINKANTSKLINVYAAIQYQATANADFKSMNIARVPGASSSNTFSAADGTGGFESIEVTTDANYFASGNIAGGTHRGTAATKCLVMRRKFLSTATQLTVKPLDVLVTTMVVTSPGTAGFAYDIVYEFSRGSI